MILKRYSIKLNGSSLYKDGRMLLMRNYIALVIVISPSLLQFYFVLSIKLKEDGFGVGY